MTQNNPPKNYSNTNNIQPLTKEYLGSVGRDIFSTYASSKQNINLDPFYKNLASFTSYGDTSIPQMPEFGNSIYDEEVLPTMETYLNYQDIRADRQPGIAKIGQGLTRMVTTAATTVVDDIAGTLYGLGEGIFNWANNGWNTYLYKDAQGNTYNSRDGYTIDNKGNIKSANGAIVGTGGKEISSYNNFMDGFVNNDISKALHTFNDKMREWMPTYTSTQYQQNQEVGEWWKNMGSAAWWADMLENTGFMIGTAVAMGVGPKVPGVGKMIQPFSKASLNSTRNVISKAAKASLEEADDLARRALRGVENLSDIGEDIIKASNQLYWKNLTNTISASTIASLGEARLEALGTGDQISAKGEDIERNYQELMQNVDRQVQSEHPEWFTEVTLDGMRGFMPNSQAIAEIERRKDFYTQQRNSALELIANQAKSMSNHVFGWNMLVLPVSNALAFSQFMTPGHQWMRMNTKSVTTESRKAVLKRLEEQGLSKDAAKEELKKLLQLEKQGKHGRDLKANWWTTRGAQLGRGLASPLREGVFEEMGQGVGQEAADHNAASRLNEFYGYTFDEAGLDSTTSWINSLAEGFNRTYTDPRGWEQGVMGALTAIIPLPMMGFTASRTKGADGKKKFNFNMTNEFWSGLTSKEAYTRAQNLAKQYNDLYNDKEGINMALVDALARAEGLNRQYQSAIDNDDNYSIIGINNKRFWNIVTLYNKLGRQEELQNLLDEIISTDAESVGKQALANLKAEELDGYVEESQLDPNEVGKKIIENATDYKQKLDDFNKIEKNIYNLYGSAELGSLNEDYLTEMSFITANIKSLEDRWHSIINDSHRALENTIRQIEKSPNLTEEQKQKLNNVYQALMRPYESNSISALSLVLQQFNSKDLQNALNQIQEANKDFKYDDSLTQSLSELNDLNRILQDRATYIDRLNKLAENPQAFSDAAKELADTFMNNLHESQIEKVVNHLKDAKTIQEFEQALSTLNTNIPVSPVTLKKALRRLTEQGNELAKDLYKSNNFINLVTRDLNISEEDADIVDEARRMFDVLKENAENFEQLTEASDNPLLTLQELPEDPDLRKVVLDLHNKALELLTNILNNNREQVNFTENTSEVTEESAEEDTEGAVEINFEDLNDDLGTDLDGDNVLNIERNENVQGSGDVADLNLGEENASDPSGQAEIPPAVTDKEVKQTVDNPKENDESENQFPESQPVDNTTKQDDDNAVAKEFKGAYEAMQEFDIYGKNVKTFERPTEKMPNYKVLYNFLKDTLKAFDNIDGKNPQVHLEKDTQIFFGISPKLDEQIKADIRSREPESTYEPFSVLLFVKDATGQYHCVGNVDTKTVRALGLEKSLKAELKDKLSDTTSNYIVSSQYSTVETILTGLVKAQGTDYKTLKALGVNQKFFNEGGRRRVLTIVRNGEFWNGDNKFGSSIVPINHHFPEGAAVLLLPTMAYDRTKSIYKQPERAFFPLILKKNYFSFNQAGPITSKVNGIISQLSKRAKAQDVDNLAVQLKQLLLTDYQPSNDVTQTLHINPMGWINGEFTEITRDDARIKNSGKTYGETPISAISFELRTVTTDENGKVIKTDKKRVLVPLKLANGQPHPDTNTKIEQLKEFLVNDVKSKYQIKRDAITNPLTVYELVDNNALSTNVESLDMLDVKSNRFKLSAMKPEDVKSERAVQKSVINEDGTFIARDKKGKELGIGDVVKVRGYKDSKKIVNIKVSDRQNKPAVLVYFNDGDIITSEFANEVELINKGTDTTATTNEQTQSTQNKIPEGKTKLDSLLDDDDKLSDERYTPERERYTEESLQRELANLERMLPNLTEQQRLELVDSLIPVVENGQRVADAGGKFSRGIITLARCAYEGTAYHEAFHAVFDLMLTNQEKIDIMNAAKQVWGNLSNKELEEKLAEGFREYAMTRDAEKDWPEKILDFFKRLLGICDNWEEIQPVFNDLYRNIYEGKYGSRELLDSKSSIEATKELQSFLNNFGIKIKQLEDYSGNTPLFDALNRTINISSIEDITNGVGEAVAFMMQHDDTFKDVVAFGTSNAQGSKGLSRHFNRVLGENWKRMSYAERDKHIKSIGKDVAKQLRHLYKFKSIDESDSELTNRINALLTSYYSIVSDPDLRIRLNAASDYFGRLAEIIKNNNVREIIKNNIKPGTDAEGTLVDIETALAENPYEEHIVSVMNQYGISLAGGASIAAEGTMYRPSENPLHDLDFNAKGKTKEEIESALEENFKYFDLSNTIVSDGDVTLTYLILDRPFIQRVKMVTRDPQGKQTKVWGIYDENDNLLGTRVYSDLFLEEGVQGKMLDFFMGNKEDYKSKEYTYNGKKYLISDARNALKAKILWERDKDIFDYTRFIPNDFNSEFTVDNPNTKYSAELNNYTKEMQQIKDQAIANGTFMRAPNGKPTNLNERQWLQVRTKAFKNWFGDWESVAARIANAKVIWGHPGIGKTEYYKNNNNVIDFDSVYKPRINKELGLPEGAEERKKWRREHRDEYRQKILSLFDEAVKDAKEQGKQLLVSDMVVLQERENALDLITQMSEDTFAKRSIQRNEPYDDNKKLWKTDIDESITKVSDKSKVVNTEKYLSELYEDAKNVSKVVDENGEPQIEYSTRFTKKQNEPWIFGKHNAIYMTSDYTQAESYKFSRGLEYSPEEFTTYSFYSDIKNPLIIDAKGNKYTTIEINGKTFDTDTIVPYAKSLGYDGVIIENVVDDVDYGYGSFVGRTVIAFRSNQVKVLDNTEFSRKNDDARYSIERYYTADTSSPKAQKTILKVAKAIKPTGKGILIDGLLLKDLIKKERNKDFYTINRGADFFGDLNSYTGTYTRADKVLAVVKRKLNELGILNAFEFTPYGTTYKVGIRFDDIKNPEFVDNPTTLSNEVYARLSPAERETARHCYSK